MKKIYTKVITICAAYFLLSSNLTNAQLSVMGTGSFTVGGISNNGIVSLQQPGAVYKWNTSGGLVTIATISNGYSTAGMPTITTDGTKISASITNTANNFNEIANYDVASSTWTTLGGLVTSGWDGYISSSWGMSSNGNTVVGLGWLTAANAHAVKWTAANGIQDLGSIVSGRSSRANAVNSDGSVIVGWQDEADGSRLGAKWVNGVESFILDNTGATVGEAGAISDDGNVIVGSAMPNPYVLVGSNLTYITHPNSGTFFRGAATSVSGDGQKIVGYYRSWPGPPAGGEGFIWTASGGRINLNDYATSLGVNTQGIIMSLPLAISKDGLKIAGMGRNASSQTVAFFLDLTQYLSTKDTFANNDGISFYPNPTKDFINIKGNHKLEKAEIYNMVGQKVLNLNNVEQKINISTLETGNYILKYTTKGVAQKAYKFVKE